jgi:alpha-tubulin suppressor-like RCC1 family protein
VTGLAGKFAAKFAALVVASLFTIVGCGASAPKPVDPVGGVTAAIEAAKSGGTLKAMDLVTCLTTGGAAGSAFSGLFGGITGDAFAKAGITPDDLTSAWKISFENLQATERSRSGTTATVHVTVKVTSEVDAGKMRELVKKFGATQGIVPDDATIDAAIQAKLAGQMKMSETIDKDLTVVQQGDTWVACGGAVAIAATPGVPAPTVAPTLASVPPVASLAPTSPAGAASGNAIAVVAGSAHNCALLSDGSVRCWGDNQGGQLGDGSRTRSESAVTVAGLTGVTAISSWAGTYTCALTGAGGVKCWGSGAVGSGATSPTLTPADVAGLTSGVRAISAGFDHACAVTDGGGVTCWGLNGLGQLGNGSTTASSAPVPVTGLTSGVAAVAAGQTYTCALTAAGGVKCWGTNASGQLGNGSTTASLVPVDVVGLSSGVRAIAAGASYTCAVLTSGGVKCWGGGTLAIPTDISAISGGIKAIYPAIDISCVSLDGGGLKCWSIKAGTAMDLPGLDQSATAVAFGSQATFCVLLSTGGVTCAHGSAFVPVAGLEAGSSGAEPPPTAAGTTAAIAVGFQHTCILTTSGGAKCLGYNPVGEIGNGTTATANAPVDVLGLTSGVATIRASFGFTCAVTTAGAAKCWGRNDYGQLGVGTTANSVIPVDVRGLSSGVRGIALGQSHACALTSAGDVMCWGQNGSRQLGTGTSTDSPIPVAVSKLTRGIKAIDASALMTCAVTGAGGVSCWGTGYMGNGLSGNASLRNEVPKDVVGLTSGVGAIAVGGTHACVLRSSGGVSCWGANDHGQLGNGGTAALYPNVPANATVINGVATIDAGKSHTCAVTTAGGVRCWGANAAGQLGDGTTADRASPTDVAGLTSGIASIQAGDDATCAVTTSGAVKCWGKGYGTTPIDVAGL